MILHSAFISQKGSNGLNNLKYDTKKIQDLFRC